MSVNNKPEEDYTNVALVGATIDLPYIFIPYHSIASARAKHPNDMIYVYEGHPAGFKIVAFPIFMTKKEAEAAEAKAEAEANNGSA